MQAPGRTSLIDAVDERDEPIGQIPRGEALAAGVGFRTAHVFVLNGQGELLLQKLASGRERHPGRWGSSVAAYLNSGEGYADAATRRLREELGLALELRFIGKLEMRDGDSLKFVTLFMAFDGEASILRARSHREDRLLAA